MAHTSLISLSRITVPSTREAPDSAGGNGAADHNADSGAVLVGPGTGTGGPHRSTAIDGPPTPHDEGPRGERGPSGSP